MSDAAPNPETRSPYSSGRKFAASSTTMSGGLSSPMSFPRRPTRSIPKATSRICVAVMRSLLKDGGKLPPSIPSI